MVSSERINFIRSLLDVYEEIPEDQWCTRVLTDEQDRHCAMGHLGARKSEIPFSLAQNLCWPPVALKASDVVGLIGANDADVENPKRGMCNFLLDLLEKLHAE